MREVSLRVERLEIATVYVTLPFYLFLLRNTSFAMKLRATEKLAKPRMRQGK